MARLSDLVVIGMLGWLTFSWLLVLLVKAGPLNALSVLATLITIGLLIAAELVSGYGTVTLRDKVSVFAYGGFIIFVIAVIVRVRDILLGQ